MDKDFGRDEVTAPKQQIGASNLRRASRGSSQITKKRCAKNAGAALRGVGRVK
jgi:hypothetical protein